MARLTSRGYRVGADGVLSRIDDSVKFGRKTSAHVTKAIYVLNGPNLNRLGLREPEIYGTTTLGEIEAMCRKAAGEYPVEFRQSGIVINPAGLTFTSIPILDALKMFPGPIFELHITNVHRREPIYHNSLVSKVATAVMMGLGADGYPTAVAAMARLLGRR
jgi:3-dehydroquinate dehydratase-2